MAGSKGPGEVIHYLLCYQSHGNIGCLHIRAQGGDGLNQRKFLVDL